LVCLAAWLALAGAAVAQFQDARDDRKGAPLGETAVQRWQAGVIVTAEGGPCQGLAATIAVPIDWPEQEVRIVEEDITPAARASYQMLDGTVKLLVVKIPHLPGGQQAKALVTLEIRRSSQLAPEHTEIYRLADPRKLARDVRPYLGPSPSIESQNPRFKSIAKQVMAQKENAWDKVEALYDWVREKVEFKSGRLKGAAAALKDGSGNHEDLACLFIALCRAGNIPARTVWVPKHCYPEFYLLDDEGVGHWFPCQVAGKREFGGISERGPILAKGDQFRDPQSPREKLRFPAETLTGEGGNPRVQFVRKALSE
jgi:hypothetical protein